MFALIEFYNAAEEKRKIAPINKKRPHLAARKRKKMQEIAKKEYTQICKQLPKLRQSQLDLYELICNCNKNNQVLNVAEAFEIYKKYGSGSYYDERMKYDHEKDCWISGIRQWTEWHWKQNFKMWILHTLGALLWKGYLTVLPTIDFSELLKQREEARPCAQE